MCVCVCYDWTRLSVKRPWGASHHPSNYKHLQKLMRQFYTEYRVSFKNSCLCVCVCVCYLVSVCVCVAYLRRVHCHHTHHPLAWTRVKRTFWPSTLPLSIKRSPDDWQLGSDSDKWLWMNESWSWTDLASFFLPEGAIQTWTHWHTNNCPFWPLSGFVTMQSQDFF